MDYDSRNNSKCSGNMGSADIDIKSVFAFYDFYMNVPGLRSDPIKIRQLGKPPMRRYSRII